MFLRNRLKNFAFIILFRLFVLLLYKNTTQIMSL